MQFFDIRTLLAAVALATAFCAGARILLWRMHPTMPGLGRWALASVVALFAFILLALDGDIAWLPSLSLAQLLVVAGLLIMWDGFRAFLGRRPVPLTVMVVFALAALGVIEASHLEQNLVIRAFGNAMLVAILSALVARELLIGARRDRLAQRATAWIYVANTAFFLLRAIASVSGLDEVTHWSPDGFAPYALFWWLCAMIATTLGMVLMASERLQAHLDRQASLDPLTGTLNRRAFAVFVEKELARSRRHNQPLSVLMMDLDHFKQINDRLGHSGGDDVLCRFVAVAERELRGEDILCRFGGEEFVALLPGTRAEHAFVAAERLREAFAVEAAALAATVYTLPFAITASVGIGELSAEEDFEGLLRRADEALYRAKAAGRNRCELATAAQQQKGGNHDTHPLPQYSR